MTFSKERLQTLLPGRPLRYYSTVGSSNDMAMFWLREGAPAGAVVLADEQTAGRGRKGRLWYTPPGVALAVSYILRPQPEQLNRIAMMGAVAVVELCQHFGAAEVGIKWPNDVQIADKKICGILPEAAWDGPDLQGVVLGIGVNIRVNLPDELRNIATNLEDAISQPIDRAQAAAYLIQRLDNWSQQLSSLQLFDRWRHHLTTVGKTVRVEDVVGVVESVDESGALIIRTSIGSTERVIAGDVMIDPTSDDRSDAS